MAQRLEVGSVGGVGGVRARWARSFAINLVANLALPPILFGLKRRPPTLPAILGTLVWALIAIRPTSRRLAAAQLPYLAWVTAAPVLQTQITTLNRGQNQNLSAA